jgi:hypothetical protein
MATKKRASKVAKGAFKDTNIHYFGETVVIWNIHEFMSVTKWREDAVRRSKRKLDGVGGGSNSSGSSYSIGKRKKCNNDNNLDGNVTTLASKKKPKQQSRRKKFAKVCQVLLQNSLTE